VLTQLTRFEMLDLIDSLKLAADEDLSARNREIVKDRFISGMTYQELSNKYGREKERCRQIVLKAVKMIRYTLNREV
jgi:RNA polymerase sigma factor (sigma-70 family)